MTILKRGDTWWMDFMVNGHRHRESCKTDDKKLAQRLHDERRAELWKQRHLGEKPRRTWKEAAAQWKVEKAHKRSIDDDKAKLDLLAPKLDSMYLDEIDRSLVTDLVKDFPTPATKNRYTALIRSILRIAAREWKWLDSYPALLVLPENNKRKVRLSTEQADAIVAALPEKYRPAARLAALTGLRSSNVFRMTWADVNLAKRTVWVEPEHAKGGERITVPLSEPVVALIESLPRTSPYVLGGMPQVPHRTWRRAIVEANRALLKQNPKAETIREDFRWHDWRHVWTSWHLDAGTSKSELMEMAGWKTASMVERYGCAAPEALIKRADAIGTFLSQAAREPAAASA